MHQKTNGIVKKFIEESSNSIYLLKFKIQENFKIIQYVYSLLYHKIYNRINNFDIQKKKQISFFQTGKQKHKMDQSFQRLLINCQHLENVFW